MRHTILALTFVALGTVGAFADTISTNGVTTQFTNLAGQNFLQSGINAGAVGGTPYFVNPSGDAGFNQGTNRNFTSGTSNNISTANLNLGNFLTGNGDWTGNPLSPSLTNSNLNLLNNVTNGTANPGSAPANFFFNNTNSTYQMTLLLSLTGNNLEFGWYNTATPGTLNPLFSNTGCNPGGVNTCARGAQGAGGATTVSFTPGVSYGFYIRYLNTTGFGAGWTS